MVIVNGSYSPLKEVLGGAALLGISRVLEVAQGGLAPLDWLQNINPRPVEKPWL